MEFDIFLKKSLQRKTQLLINFNFTISKFVMLHNMEKILNYFYLSHSITYVLFSLCLDID